MSKRELLETIEAILLERKERIIEAIEVSNKVLKQLES